MSHPSSFLFFFVALFHYSCYVSFKVIYPRQIERRLRCWWRRLDAKILDILVFVELLGWNHCPLIWNLASMGLTMVVAHSTSGSKDCIAVIFWARKCLRVKLQSTERLHSRQISDGGVHTVYTQFLTNLDQT